MVTSTIGPSPVDPEVQRLIAAVDGHRTGDSREAASRAEILVDLRSLDKPFDRNDDLTHVTASGIVIGRRGVLLHRHRRLHRWLQPGGHLEPGETPEDGALRECEEETGLRLAHPSGEPVLLHVDVHEAAEGHVHLDIRYLLVGPDRNPAPPPEESQEVAWFTWDEADALADDALGGALRSARRLIGTGTVMIPGGTTEESDG